MNSPASGLTPLVAGMLWNKGGQSNPPDTTNRLTIPISQLAKPTPVDWFDPPEIATQFGPFSTVRSANCIGQIAASALPHKQLRINSHPATHSNSRIRQYSPEWLKWDELGTYQIFRQPSQAVSYGSQSVIRSTNLETLEYALRTIYYANINQYATPWSDKCLQWFFNL